MGIDKKGYYLLILMILLSFTASYTSKTFLFNWWQDLILDIILFLIGIFTGKHIFK